MVYKVSIMTMNMRELSAYICWKLAPIKISSLPGIHALLFESQGPCQDWFFRGLSPLRAFLNTALPQGPSEDKLQVSGVKKASGDPPPTTPLHPIASPSELCSLLHIRNISVSLVLELLWKETQQQNSLKNTHRGRKKNSSTQQRLSAVNRALFRPWAQT